MDWSFGRGGPERIVAWARQRSRALRACAALVTAASLVTTPAWAGPKGGQVVGGQAIIQTLNQETLINQSTKKSIINWNSYNVLKGESVIYQEPNAKSISLNRVLGGQAATILGKIQSNGQVWLVDPNGVLFGKGATVNAAGLLATTADIANSDFMGGKYQFGIASPNAGASVVNQGTITTQGGSTVLAAPNVDNEGTVTARLGTVAVGAGKTFAVDFDGDNLLNFAVTAPAANAQIKNAGTIAADGGTVQLTARSVGNIVDNVINTTGIVQANSVSIKNGTVILDGGANGGVTVGGTVSAQGLTAGTTGGTVQVTGAAIDLTIGANINVSGQAGGGLALIGGNFHGAGPLPNAQTVTIAQGATIDADATANGNGGEVAVWSQQQTNFNGAITARGGPNGGNGGYVETSSAADLAIGTGTVNTLAPNGQVGTWLLDPENIDIVASGGTGGPGDAFGDNPGGTDAINASTIDAAESNVILQAANQIDFQAPISMANAGVGLSAEADIIKVETGAGITTQGGGITLSANDPESNQSGGGYILLNAPLNTAGSGATGGAVLLTLNGASGASNTITLGGGTITTGNGTVTVAGTTVLAQSLTVDTTNGGANTGADITFNGSVDGVSTGGQSLTLMANRTPLADLDSPGACCGNDGQATPSTDGGTVTLVGNVGSTVTLGNVEIGGAALNLGGDIKIGDSSQLSVFAPITLAASSTIDAGAGYVNLFYAGNIDATSAGAQSLTIDSTQTVILPTIGANTPLGDLTINGSAELHGHITTAGGAIDITGNALTFLDQITDTTGNGQAAGADITIGSLQAGNLSISLTLNAGTGGTVSVGNIGTDTGRGTYGNVILDGAMLLLGGDINTAGGQVSLNGATVLNAGGSTQYIDTTNGGAVEGATVTFNGTLDDNAAFAHTLTLSAGSGDIVFNGRVGANNPAVGPATGVTPGGIVITSANNVDINVITSAPNFDGFHVGQFVVEATGDATCTPGECIVAAANINAPDAYISTFNPTGNAGAVTIAVSGNVEIGGDVFAGGGINGAIGKSGGNVTVVAGGNVQIGDKLGLMPCDVVACTTAGALPDIQYIGVMTAGYSAGFDGGSGESAGNGGVVNIVAGGNITLPNGVVSNGGAAILNGALGNGGAGGAVTISSSGGTVAIGVPTGTVNNGNVAGVDATGGSTINGLAGNGADVSISGERITLTHVYAAGGDTTQSSGEGTAGNITLTATANTGAAITLYGESDSRTTTTPGQATLDTRGGKTGGTAGTNLLKLSGGTINGKAGQITIQGDSEGDPLQGGAYVRLVDNGAGAASNGGATFYILAAGGALQAGAINLLGPIEGFAGDEGLRVQGGTITVGGNIGDVIPLDYVSFKSITPMQLGGDIYTQASGSCAQSPCDGSVTFLAPVDLTRDVIVSAGGAVDFQNTLDGAHGLTILADGNVTLGGNAGLGTPLTSLFVQGADISLQNVTTAGPQSYIDGAAGSQTITLNGNLTDTTATDIALRGDNIDFASPGITIQTAGTISTGNVVLIGNIENPLNGTLNAGNGLVWVNQTLDCSAFAACTMGPTQTLSGWVNVANLDQDAHILLSDDTTLYTNHGAMTVMPSIDAAPGDTASLTIKETGGAWGGITLNGVIGGGNAVSNLTVRTIAGSPDGVAMAGIGSSVLGGVLSTGDGTVEIDTYQLTLNGNITTQGAPVTIDAAGGTTLSSPSLLVIDTGLQASGNGGALTLNTNINSSTVGVALLGGTNPLSLGDIAINGSVNVNGAVTVQGGNVSLGGNVTAYNNPVLVSAGSGQITLTNNVAIDSTGQSYGAGGTIQLFGDVASDSADTPRALSLFSGAGQIVLNGNLGTADAPLGAITVFTAGQITLNGGTILTAGRNVTFGGAQIGGGVDGDPTLLGNIVATDNLTIDTTGNYQNLGAGITLGLPIDAATPGGSSLTLIGGTAGRIDIAAPVGASTPIGDFTATANQIVLGANISTQNGVVTFNGPVILDGQVTVDTTAGNIANPGADITFASTIDSNGGGNGWLTAFAGFQGTGGVVTFAGDIGGSTPIGNLLVNGGSVLLGGNITTQQNNVQFDTDVVLLKDVTINTSAGQVFNVPAGNVTFNATVDASTSGGQSLTIQAGGEGGDSGMPGTVTFAADVGGTTALNTLLVRGGDMSLQNVTTVGSQYYVANGVDGAQGTVTLHGNLSAGSGVINLPATGTPGSDIQFMGNVSVAATGPVAVTTDGSISGGEILINGSLGGNTGNLTLDATGGGSATSGGLIVIGGKVLQNSGAAGTVADAGSQGFDPNVAYKEGPTQLLTANSGSELDLNVAALDQTRHILIDTGVTDIELSNGGGGVVLVTPTIDMAANLESPPALNASGANGITMSGTIGDAAPFGSLNLAAASGHTVTVSGGIGSPVMPGVMDGGVSLTGSSVLLGGNISTRDGAVNIDGPLTLTSDVAIDTTVFDSGDGGNVEFQGTVDGAHALAVNSGGGYVALDQTAGGTTALGKVTLTSTNEIDLGGDIRTAGAAVTFNGPVVLEGANQTIDTTNRGALTGGANVTFNGTVDGAWCDCETPPAPNVTVTAGTGGTVAILGDWGSNSALGTVTLTAGTVALGANITTAGVKGDGETGDVNINGNLVLVAGGNEVGSISDPIIDTTNGGATTGADIVIAGYGGPGESIGHIDDRLTGSDALALKAGAGDVDLEALVGQAVPIGNLSITAQNIMLGGSETDGLAINTYGAGGNGTVFMQGAVILNGGALAINTAAAGSAGGDIQFGTPEQLASIDNASGQAGYYGFNLNAGAGSVSLYANIGQATPTGGFTLTGNDFVGIGGNVTTANGDIVLNSTGAIYLGLADPISIQTQGGSFTANGPTVVWANTLIQTDTGIGTSGGNVTFNGTLDDIDALQDTLTIRAGTTTDGDPGTQGGIVTFAGRVGQSLTGDGTNLAEIHIESADSVAMTQALDPAGDGFSVGSLVIQGPYHGAGAGSVTADSFINTSNREGAGGDVTIRVTGDVTVASFIDTAGGVDESGTGQNGGKVTIVAGGNVVVDNCCSLNSGEDIYGVADAGGVKLPLSLGGLGIYTGGYDPSTEGSGGQTAGNGGDIFIKGASIDLPFGAVTLGGNTVFSTDEVPNTNGGNGGNIKLISSGAVTIGNPQFGDVVGLLANGGNSSGGSGGNAGNVTIVGDTIALTQISAVGGSTFATDGVTAGNGGNIALHATTTNPGPAVILYGSSDDATSTSPSTATLNASSGTVGATGTAGDLPYILTGGVFAGTGGSITIGGAYDSALADGAYIEIARSNAPWFNGGSTVFVAADGGPSAGGSILFDGNVEGYYADRDSLRLDAVNGIAEVTGTVGANTPLLNLVLGCCGVDGDNNPNPVPYAPGSNGGAITFDGAVTADNVIDQRLSGSLTFNDKVTTGLFSEAQDNTATDGVVTALLGGAEFWGDLNFSKASLTFGGTFTFDSSFTGSLDVNRAITLASDTVLDGTATNINFDFKNGASFATGTGAGQCASTCSLTVLAGVNNITVESGASLSANDSPLTGVILEAAQINLNNGGVTTTTLQTYIGSLVLGANTTLKTTAAFGIVELSQVSTGSKNITVSSDTVALTGDWSGTGARTLYPTTAGTKVTLGNGVPSSTFFLTSIELGFLDGGTPSMVTIGSHSPQTGAVTTSDFTFDAPLTIIGSSITLDPINKDPNTGSLTLDAGGTGGVNGTNGVASVNLGKGDFLTIDASNSVLTGTVNGQTGNGAAQYVTANNGCVGCTFNGVADGSAGGGNPSPPPTSFNNNPNNFTPPLNFPPPNNFGDNYNNNGNPNGPPIDNPDLFGDISPTVGNDLGNGDTIIISYANPPPLKPASNAEYHPQVVHPLGAYLNQMLTPSVPHNGVPGISFGYSLTGNSALW